MSLVLKRFLSDRDAATIVEHISVWKTSRGNTIRISVHQFQLDYYSNRGLTICRSARRVCIP